MLLCRYIQLDISVTAARETLNILGTLYVRNNRHARGRGVVVDEPIMQNADSLTS